MIPVTSDQYREELKTVIFELGRHNLVRQADRLNRLVFEESWDSDDKLMREVSAVLSECRQMLGVSAFRDRLAMLENVARNHRRVLGER
jgi:hypothetical protein